VVLQWCLFFFLYPVYKIYTRWSASISTYSILSFDKLDQDGTLKGSFFDFLNSYLMPREKTTDKSQKTPKNGIILIFLTLCITL